MVILTSDLQNCKKENDRYVATDINNENKLVDIIKENLKGNRGITFIASSEDSYDKTDSYSSVLFESLKMSGINFDNYYVLDGRTKDKASLYLENSDMVFLAGGDTFFAIKFFNKIDLRSKIKDYKGLVVGQSCGSINLACNVYNSPECEEELKRESKWQGLCLTNISIEPHFIDLDDKLTENQELQRREVLKESYNRISYGLFDGAFITDEKGEVIIHGKCYKIENGSITPICENKEVKRL